MELEFEIGEDNRWVIYGSGSGEKDTWNPGVAIWIRQRWKGLVKQVERKSDRLMWVTMETPIGELRIICAHAPHQGRPEGERKGFLLY